MACSHIWRWIRVWGPLQGHTRWINLWLQLFCRTAEKWGKISLNGYCIHFWDMAPIPGQEICVCESAIRGRRRSGGSTSALAKTVQLFTINSRGVVCVPPMVCVDGAPVLINSYIAVKPPLWQVHQLTTVPCDTKTWFNKTMRFGLELAKYVRASHQHQFCCPCYLSQ